VSGAPEGRRFAKNKSCTSRDGARMVPDKTGWFRTKRIDSGQNGIDSGRKGLIPVRMGLIPVRMGLIPVRKGLIPDEKD